VEVYLPAPDGPGQWVGFDPTNNRAPAEDYVRLALGRDYSDISPMRGVIHGGANHKLAVAVTVTPRVAAAA
jgi:transglutaminase-like putative cysteine protease